MQKNVVILCSSLLLILGLGAITYWALTRDHSQSIKGNAEIDWVDFVKLNGHTYTGLYDGVLVNPDDVTDAVAGKVKFKVGDVVSNPEYRTKEGDAAFLAIGTQLYEVEGYKPEEIIAAEDKSRIGGYRIYVEDSYYKTLNRRSFKDLPMDQVSKIELYKMNETIPYRTLVNQEQADFIHLLKSGEYKPTYTPNTQNGDPSYYSMVFYTNEPIAFSFSIADDGDHVFFYPWDLSLVDNRIRTLMADPNKS
ncbi:hypothetical protein PghCCS26_36680 [Paenibacillus glycanilyticus]|uniref:DUF3298 domain-containing protein n=1 Tax=Paenibacillus glycanilyticus TaxID=126569 RepID=A0ABQ6NP09_9BACL|nr:hypothetical protein [Paenibacillus glycanilyticus]GMK46539.1 hypothetical protein PghCCS26_36680 [Paenibacillus glycanilyticus]